MDGGVAERLTGPGPVVGRVSRTGQDGTVLFLGLALLLAITAAALSAAQTTSLELRMSRNSHDAALAFHAADAALAEAELWLDDNGDPADARVHSAGTPYGAIPAWQDETAWGTHGQVVRTRLPDVVERARYLIEWVTTYETETEPPSGILVDVFRVTARGVGNHPMTVVRLQTTYARTRHGDATTVPTGRLSWVELEA